MHRYVFRKGTRLSPALEADVVGSELERINVKFNGLTPTQVVEEARPEDSPLHPAFTWDDAEAGRVLREGQARSLIRCVLVAPEKEEMAPTHAFVHVPPKPDEIGRKGVYVNPDRLIDEPDMFARALGGAIGRLESAQGAVEELRQLAQGTSSTDAIISAQTHLQKGHTKLDSLRH